MKISKQLFVVLIVFVVLGCSTKKSTLSVNTMSEENRRLAKEWKESFVPIGVTDSIMIAKRAITGIFRITKITKTKGMDKKGKWTFEEKDVYIIDAIGESYTVNDTLVKNAESCYYTIVSIELAGRRITEIKIGNKYKFVLNPYFKKNRISWNTNCEIVINGVKVSVWPLGLNIYTTPNLEGLYYIGP